MLLCRWELETSGQRQGASCICRAPAIRSKGWLNNVFYEGFREERSPRNVTDTAENYPGAAMPDPRADVNPSLKQAGTFIAEKWGQQPHLVIITGSGLDYVSELVSAEVEIAYHDIPGFPRTHARGHSGSLMLGHWERLKVAVLRGRGHYYEGYSMAEIALPVQTLARIGARAVLVTSAVGSVTPELTPGTLTLVSDHLNLVQANPLIGRHKSSVGVRYPDLLHAYSPRLRAMLHDRLKRETGRDLPEAVLAFMSGPCFETDAELKWLNVIGADIVGWSLVPEVITAVHAGLEVMAIALVTDYSHSAHVEKVDVDRIFQIGPSLKSQHLPVFEAALAIMELALMRGSWT